MRLFIVNIYVYRLIMRLTVRILIENIVRCRDFFPAERAGIRRRPELGKNGPLRRDINTMNFTIDAAAEEDVKRPLRPP